MEAEDDRERAGPSPLRAKFTLAILAFLLPAAAIELGARLLFEPPPGHAFPGLSRGSVADDELLWKNLPGYRRRDVNGPINSLGLRGPEVRLARSPGVTRILSVGESTTFGDGVQWNQTYSHLLQRELRERGHRNEVWNAGQRAWSSVQSLRFLELELEHLDPDLVLFYHEVNDFLPTVLRSVRVRSAGLTDRETMALISGRSWLLRFIRSSRALTLLSLAQARRRADQVIQAVGTSTGTDVILVFVTPYQRIQPIGPGEGLPWMENPNPLVRVPDPDREWALRKLVRLTRDKGVKLVLYHPAYRVSVPHRCLLGRVAAEEGVPVIEVEDLLLADMRESGLVKDDYFIPDDKYHPTPEGHAVLARGTADFFEEQGLLPRSAAPSVERSERGTRAVGTRPRSASSSPVVRLEAP